MTERIGNGWQTPCYILDRIRMVDEIELDPATWPDNPTGANRFYTVEDDGLAQEWGPGLVYLNPPYGRGLMDPFVDKILDQWNRANTEMIILTRGDTSTKWSHALLRSATKVCFPPRIKFKGAKGSPNFANTIYYYGPRGWRFWNAFQDLGPVCGIRR